MSYLNALRLHFAGQFQTNVSTVNNDPYHFYNATFKPEYQDMQGPNMPNGWFNPEGDAAFRLLGCTINSAWMPSGEVGPSDPVLDHIIADSDEAAPAKIVDLDPEQQLVSEIWGLTVRIADGDGKTLMSGEFEPAAFIDIWSRAIKQGGGDTNASAMWQSVIKNLQWGDVSGSAFLTALQQAASDGLLSIKFNCDGINMSYGSPDFMCGRITGTIGPASAGEPRHLVLGRQFMATDTKKEVFFQPEHGLNFCVGLIDQENNCIYLDLGNALPSTIPGGPIADLGDLNLGYYDPILSPSIPAGQITTIGTIPTSEYAQPQWYGRTAGVVALPMTKEQLQMASARQLVLHSGSKNSIIAESCSGAFVRADSFVYRMSPGEEASIQVFATQRGVPLADTEIEFALDPSQLQMQVGPDSAPFVGASPPIGKPTDAVAFGKRVTTGADGRAVFKVTAGDPGKARWFNDGKDYGIDGQVYGIRPSFADSALADSPVNESNFISFLIWSGYAPPETLTWTDIYPIFQQYANLYPVMNRFLDLGGYESVIANLRMLKLAFGLPVSDPNSMPVTRDLSPAKRAAILKWLDSPLPGDIAAMDKARTEALRAEAELPQGKAEAPPPGGKAAAMSRRLVVQNQSGDNS
ncbi:hypothetical protein [Sedimentitalea sp.]|uniref:hypothetical protein n=1 Tax=Sedimentitalea sp. TaxID=2048915 RepID=UPI003297FA1D